MNVESWNTTWQVVSLILVLFTFAAGAGALITGNRINKRQSELIATVGKEAAQANERAERIELEAAVQRERAAKAEHSLLELQNQVAESRSKIGGISATLKGRTITPEQELAIVAALSKFRGEKITLQPVDATPEIESYSSAIEKALQKAGIVVLWVPTQDLSATGRTGHWMRIGDKREAFANAIAEVFKSTGLSGKGIKPEHSGDPDELSFWIWAKL